MLDVGFSEILLTSAIALIVLGPERLPKVARQVGNWVGRARVMARQLSEQLEREVNAEDLLKTQRKASSSSGAANAAPKIADTPNVADAANAAGTPNLADAPNLANTPTVAGIPNLPAPNPSIAPPAATPVAEDAAPATPPEPVYGLPAAATTAAAMHKPTHD
jgi:sec-independent protein translocase protein TatB